MKDILKILAWVSTGIGALLMVLGTIGRLTGGILMGHWWSNYFWPAHNFLLLGIALLLFYHFNCKKQD